MMPNSTAPFDQERIEQWTPETPFLLDPAATRPGQAMPPLSRSFALESPFLSEYALDGSAGVRTPQAEAFGQLLEELRDEEFESAVVRLVEETAAVAEETAFEGEDSAQRRFRQEQAARSYLDQVATSAEAMLEALAGEAEGMDLASLSEEALDQYFERFAPPEGEASPVADEFIKKLFKKAKSAVKGAVSLAKKGIKAVGNVLPHVLILRKLKGLVRPLLERVLRVAIDKLPVSLQPIARQLAAKVLGVAIGEEEEEETEGEEAATFDPRVVAAEFDTMVAGYLVEGEGFERGVALEAFLEDRRTDRTAIRDLDQARERLAAQLVELGEGEDPAPAVEQFLPAILTALRIGVRILGRPRVVRFLAGLLAKLIQRHVGRDNAVKLSRALVDAGLRTVSLEAEEETSTRSAGDTLAATLEDTVSRLAQTLPAEAWESETLLEAYARDAFEESAAANFPDDGIRTELHEAAEAKGVWSRRAGRRYKKYSRVPSATLHPQVAKAIPTFKGQRLSAILRDRFGIVGPVRVNVHLYEAVAGTTPGAIVRGEQKAADGPAGADESSFHPLTEEAAGVLLREPGLGRDVGDQYLESPQLLAVGQRLYQLEVTDGAPRTGAAARAARPRRIRAAVDLRRGEVRVRIYLSEVTAQEIAQAFRRKASSGTILNLIRRAFEPQTQARSEAPSDFMRVIGEGLAEEPEAVTRRVRRGLGRRLRRLLLSSLVRALGADLDRRYQQLAGEFDKAANADADGLTILVTLRGVPWLAMVRRAASRGGTGGGDGVASRSPAAASHSVDIVSGYAP